MSVSLLRSFGFCILVGFALASIGCTEVRGRQRIQKGNRLFRDGQYKEAVAEFTEAEKHVPNLWVLWLNKGYTCRQMIIPGAKTPENTAAADCALSSFKKLKEMRPQDARGELLYFQTLFDADRYEELTKIYEERYQKNNRDIEAITGLIQVYTKWNKLDEALEWYTKKAEIQANDAEAQYAVGAFLWQQLTQKGGGPDMQMFDPRPNPNKPKEKKIPPAFDGGAIVSQQRVDLADMGIKYLEKAVALRPKYFEAMTYINLLYRQKSFAYFDQPDEWQKCIDKALEWAIKSLTVQGKPIPASLQKAGAKPIIAHDGSVQAQEDEPEEDAAEEAAPAKTKKKKAAPKKKRKRGKR
jgi:tetratricopeptide (TPR) repeat protein